ncbi:flagellar assembly protein FliW [Virgibacillus halophilus]|uniref:Flagellar assembly factor FliW n=1 Tax=Tigheibacillus halophilus TaxID=361280 RepID=A0ABU5C3T1_9BACI|nr:flagellar assembly protein FliW [Virgibacillus halophilus]
MEVETKYFGKLSVDNEKVIHFPHGIPGFLDEKQFVLLDLPGNPVFQVLQSVHTRTIAFVVTNPYHFYEGYEFELDDSILNQLQLKEKQDIVIYSIVTLQNKLADSTLNLRAPIIVSAKNRLAKQYIIDDGNHPVKAPLKNVKTDNGKGV